MLHVLLPTNGQAIFHSINHWKCQYTSRRAFHRSPSADPATSRLCMPLEYWVLSRAGITSAVRISVIF